MEITRRNDYAFRLLAAAYFSNGSYISLSEAAEEYDIPYSFARSIQHDLVKVGFIKTARGAAGGFTLSCDPSKVTLQEISEELWGGVSVAPCSADLDYCSRQPGCPYNALWRASDNLITNLFKKITLEDLLTQGAQHPAIKEALSVS